MTVCTQSRAAASMRIPGSQKCAMLGLTRGRENPAKLLSIKRRLSRETQVDVPPRAGVFADAEADLGGSGARKVGEAARDEFWDLQ